MTDFNGRTILVTGASGGIGGSTVQHLVAKGADVIASGRSVEALKSLAGKTGARILPFDLTSEESIKNALEGLDLWGVVNCGGYFDLTHNSTALEAYFGRDPGPTG
jgi:L-xylulose reductase